MGSGEQCPQPKQPDFAYHQTLVGWAAANRSIAASASCYVTVGPALQQCLHQNTGRRERNTRAVPARNRWSTAAHIRCMAPSRSPRRPSPARPTRRRSGVRTEVKPPAQAHVADSRQQLQSAVTLCDGVAMYQREAHRQPGIGQCEIVTGSFGDPQRIVDLAQRGVVGLQHAARYRRNSTSR